MEANLRNNKPPRFGRLSRKRPKPSEVVNCQDVKKEALNSECANISENEPVVDECDEEKSNPAPPILECQSFISCPLPNIGSTCFFNSVIQILRFTPGFLLCLHQMTYVHSLWKNGEIPIILTQLHGLFMEMKRLDTSKETNSLSHAIEKILKLFSEDCSHYKFEQFDAHEFLSWVLKIMLGVPEFDSNGKKSGASWGKRKTKLDDVTDFRSQFLNGQLTTHLICCECENAKRKTEDYWDLAFKVNAQDLERETLSEDEPAEANLVNESLLDLVCQESILRDSNKYFCEECLHHVEARLKIEIENFPQVLIFHPNQIGTATYKAYSKNLNAMPIHETISCSHSKCVQPCDKHVYQIYGVVVHIGTMMHAGHYVALININPILFEKHQKLSRMEEKVQLQPMTRRLKRKISNEGATTKTCCWPNWLKENNRDEDGGWILFNDDTIEWCKNDNIKQILSEELGTLATPSVLLYFRL